jgi:sugar lactone lactonase YvrE
MKTKRFFIVLAVLVAVALIATSTALAAGAFKAEPKVKILVQGAPIHGSNGLFYAPDGNLYVASTPGGEIVVLNPKSGAIIRRIGYDQGVATPDDVFVTADGSIYWTAIMSGEVAKLSPDGVKTVIASGLPGVNPITFSDDGRLFVARDFWGAGLYEMDPNGINPPRPILPDLANLNGFDFGPDGWLYGPIIGGPVVRIHVDTAEMQTVSQFSGSAVKFNSQGQLYGVSHISGEVARIDVASGDFEVLAIIQEGGDNLTFSPDDRLFVSVGESGAVVEVKPGGKIRTVSRGGLMYPMGLAVQADAKGFDRVYVADFWTIRQFNGKSGKMLDVTRAPMGSALVPPMTMAADGENFIISSFLADAVQIWNPETKTVLESFPLPNKPLNAIRFQGDLLVAELMTGQVVRLNPAGNILVGQFYLPTGMAASADDLWVADFAAGIIYAVVVDGVTLAQPTPVASGLAGPEGVALDQDGNLLVVETVAGRLSKVDLATGVVNVVAEGLLFHQPLPTDPPIGFFNGVAVGPSGTIYVTGDQNNVLYSIKSKK